MAESRGVEPHPISENPVFKAGRRTNAAALLSKIFGGDKWYRSTLLGLWSQCASIYAISPYQVQLFSCYHYTNVKTNSRLGFEPSPSFLQKDYFWLLKWTYMVNLVPSRGNDPLSIGYQPIALPLSYEGIFGAEDKIWTCDTRIFNPLLYQLSYIGKNS